jgi:hypothetical protein
MKRLKNPKLRIIVLALIALIVMACAITINPSTSVEPPPQQDQPTAQPTVPAVTLDPITNCPTPIGDTQLYINREDGYCFLYPGGFSITTSDFPPYPSLNITGAQVVTPAPSQMEGFLFAAMNINRNGPPEGMDATSYATRWLELFARGTTLTQEPFPMEGVSAVMVRNVPSYGSQRSAFIVSPWARYTIDLFPEPEFSDPLIAMQANLVWDAVLDSIKFFEPQSPGDYVRADDICPAAGSGQRAYRNLVDGYCYLYPDDFTEDPTFPGRIIGGPIWGDLGDFQDVQTNMVVGTFGKADGQTPRDMLYARPSDMYDSSSLLDTTMGGNPAVVFTNIAGPWHARDAIIVTSSDAVYTIVSQPLEPVQFPHGIPYLDRLWSKITSSLQFFSHWR